VILQPPAVLLAGPAGSGKTSALATQLLYGLEVFVIVTEPDGVASLLDACERLRAPIDHLHWCYCAPTSAGWGDLEDMITKISSMDQKQLADQRDMGKASFRPAAMKFLNSFRNFTCDRTGQSYGDFTKWDDQCSLNVDSLTGWSIIGFGCTVGYKPTANPGEWGIAQNFVHNMLLKINTDRHCYFNLTAHVEKEMDEMLGIKKIMVSTIGAKLAPKIPPFFSEVVKCSRTVDAKGNPSFTWSTYDTGMDLKNRALPMSANLPADFKPVIEAYKRRLATITGTPLAGASPSPAPNPAPGSTPTAIVPPSAPMRPSATSYGTTGVKK
jgi:hypothetical protein